MKRLMAYALILLMILSLAACGSSRASAQQVVEDGIAAVQKVDVSAMQSYWGYSSFDNGEDVDGDASDDPGFVMMKEMASGITYKIISSVEDEESGTALVTVEFTNTDMKPIIKDLMEETIAKLLGYAILPEDEQPTQDEVTAMFVEQAITLMEQEDNPKITTTVEISLTLTDDGWVITPTNEAVDAMFGGIGFLYETMASVFSTQSEAQGE